MIVLKIIRQSNFGVINMNRICSTLLCFVACCGLLWLSGCPENAQIETESTALSAEKKVSETGGEPTITFSELGHDFGVVSPNKLHKADIKFTNSGQSTLTISKVSKCCGVIAKLAGDRKVPADYAPGESGAIHLEWRSGSQPMVFTRELVVHSNDKTNPAAKLKIQAKVVLKVTWEPKRLRLVLDEENAGSGNITIECTDGRPFSITSFKSTGDCIAADFDPSAEATKFVLEPKVNMEKLHKNQKGRITIGLTHPDGNAAIVLFDVLPKYTINPPLLIVFNAEPGEPIVRKITVLNNYKQDFGFNSLTSKTGTVGVKVLSKRKITNGYQLEVELTPPAFDGNMKFMDVFNLVLDNDDQLPIRCSGYYKKTKPVTTIKYR